MDPCPTNDEPRQPATAPDRWRPAAYDQALIGICWAFVIGYLNGIAMQPWWVAVMPILAGSIVIGRRVR